MKNKKYITAIVIISLVAISIFFVNNILKKKDAMELTPKEYLEKNK